MSMLTSVRYAALLAFACGFAVGGGSSHAATPPGAAALAALDDPTAPAVGPPDAAPVRVAEDDVDDETDDDGDDADEGSDDFS